MAFYNGTELAGMGVNGLVNIDEELSTESTNPIANKAVAEKLLNTFRSWQPGAEYKFGDFVLTQVQEVYGPPDELSSFDYIIGMMCIKDHISPEIQYPNLAEDFYDNWASIDFYAKESLRASNDIFDRPIYATYATKEEVVGTLGTINEVLATLVEVE